MTDKKSGYHRFGVDLAGPASHDAVEVQEPHGSAPDSKAPSQEKKWFVWQQWTLFQNLFAEADTEIILLIAL